MVLVRLVIIGRSDLMGWSTMTLDMPNRELKLTHAPDINITT